MLRFYISRPTPHTYTGNIDMIRIRTIFMSFVAVVLVGVLMPIVSTGADFPDIVTISETTVTRWNFNTSNDIYQKDTGTRLFGDMTRTNDGRYLAYRTSYSGGNTPALFEINPDTGISHMVVQSSTGASEVIALTTTLNGDLFACDNGLGFIRINPNTLAYISVPIIALNFSYRTMYSGGMATSPTGEIYAWAIGSSSTWGIYSKLFKIDPNAGTALAIGGYDHLSLSQSFNAMAFTPDGRLFGFTEINAGGPLVHNGIYQLNLQTGMPTLLAQRSELVDVRGAVFVPEPTSFLLLALSGVSFALYYCWQKRACATIRNMSPS